MSPNTDANSWFRESIRQKEEKADEQHRRNSEDIDELKAVVTSNRRDIDALREQLRKEMREYVTQQTFSDALKLIEERYRWFVWLVRAAVVGGLVGIGAKLMTLIGLGK